MQSDTGLRDMLPRTLPEPLASLAASLGNVLLAQVAQSRALMSLKEIDSGRYIWVNGAMATLLGRPADEVIGLTDGELSLATAGASLRAAEQSAAALPGGATNEHKIDVQGTRREFSVLRVPIARADEVTARYLCSVWTELTEPRHRETQLRLALEQLEQQQKANQALRRELQDQALRDDTTGLYNHAHFEDQLRREVDLSSREHREFALVSVVIDPLNDAAKAAGEAGRTRILEALGRLLRSNTRAMDASCHFDDDSFAVLLSGVGLATAHSRMEGLRRQCATQIVVLEGRELGFTVSMGVASFPHTAGTQEELMRAATTALAEAQRRGGNHVALASIRFETGA
jgi:diguanylate cyclase (GGDEF)-like protein